jgi:hypothetical protein
MLQSKIRLPQLNKREKEIQDDTIKRYILNILKEDTDASDVEKKAVLEILQNLDKKSKQA